MKPSRRSSLTALLSICVLNVLLRFPRTEHEVGVDSFVWHGMATSLTREHLALWIVNPLSYFGLYPLSQPSGSVFFLGGLTEVAGIPVEASIIMADIGIALVGALGGFLLAREFSRRDRFALLLSFVMSTTPEFVGSLLWQVPTRIAFTSLIPILLWAIIRLSRSAPIRNGGVVVLVLALMMSFHRLAILMALVALASLAALIVAVAMRALRIQFPSLLLKPMIFRNTSWFALVGILLLSAIMISSTNVLQEYSTGVVATGDSFQVRLLNLFVSLARSGGMLLPFVFLGVVVLVRRRAKGFAESFVVLSLIAFLPTLFLRQYTGFYTIPLTSLFIVVGLDKLLSKVKSHRGTFAMVAAVAAFALVSGQAIVSYDLSQDSSMTFSEYSLGLYSQTTGRGTWLFTDGLEGARVASVHGRPYLPVGGATTAFQGPELLIFGYLDPAHLVIHPLRPGDLTIESDSPFVLEGVQAEADWATMLMSPADSIPTNLAHVYDARYLVTTAEHPYQYYAYGRLYPSELAVSAQATRYAAYTDGDVTLWLLG